MSSPSTGFSAHVTVTVAPENVTKFLDAFKLIYERTIEEPDCTFFEAYESPDEPGKLSWIENWTKPKEVVFAEQANKDYFKEYIAVAEPLFLTREFRFFTPLPQFHMDKQAPPEVATTAAVHGENSSSFNKFIQKFVQILRKSFHAKS